MNGSNLNLRAVALASMLGLGLALTACKKEEETPMERATEAVKDGLNVRDNEKLKDAGEDAKDAMENVGEAIEEKVEQ
ncbi:MAG TPA: hypothetical protein VGE57_11160 [Solimonas sp.]